MDNTRASADALAGWRQAEADYAQAVRFHLDGEHPRIPDRDLAVRLFELRVRADRYRDRYFKATVPH